MRADRTLLRAAASSLRPTVVVVVAVVLAASSAACSTTSGRGERMAPGGTSLGSTGPAAALSGPVTEGHLVEPVSARSVDLSAHGYVEQEFFVSGTASSYAAVGGRGSDGKWQVQPAGSAPYRTRVVVRRPADPRRFSGTVLVEWLNVSSGLEADPDWTYLRDEILRAGDAYVGVSVQALGVVGGPGILSVTGASTSGLRAEEPSRYGSLTHPGDAYSYDIFAQTAQAIRARGLSVLGPLRTRRVVAVGESQSAYFLTTFADAIQPRTHDFDGFFIHSRGGGAAGLGGQLVGDPGTPRDVHIRNDLGVPVMTFETESDLGPLLDFGPARQPDTAHFRLWEVAGTAHADAYLVAGAANLLGCTEPINEGPEHFVAEAALHALDTWVAGGRPPPSAARLQLASTRPPSLARDALGNALGGVRTPAVDVATAALSGEPPPGTGTLCSLFGSTRPFDTATLVRLYRTKDGYLRDFTAALDRAIEKGFLLPSQRAQLLAGAQAVVFPPPPARPSTIRRMPSRHGTWALPSTSCIRFVSGQIGHGACSS